MINTDVEAPNPVCKPKLDIKKPVALGEITFNVSDVAANI